MSWLESQMGERARFDAEMSERAYAELAASVTGDEQLLVFTANDEDGSDHALSLCLKYLGVSPGKVPGGVTDVEQRIEWMCRPSGTMHRTVRLEGTWYRDCVGPLLGSLESGEAVALLPGLMGGYECHDPATGRKVRVTRKVAQGIGELAVCFYRPFPQEELGLRDLARFVSGLFDRNDYLVIVLAAAFSTLVGLLLAWTSQVAFGTVVPSGQNDLIVPIGALLTGVAASSILINICRNLVTARVSTKIRVAVEAAAFARMLMLPSSFFKRYASGNLANRMSQVTMLVSQVTGLVLGSGLTVLLSLVYIVQIAFYAPALALPSLVVLLLQVGLTILVSGLSARRKLLAMEANAHLSGTVTALLGGIQKLKLAGAEERAFAHWAHDYARYARSNYDIPVVERALPALVMLIGTAGTIVIYYLAASTGVSLANFASFNTAYGQVSAAVFALSGMVGQFAQISPMLEMIRPILATVPEAAEDKPIVSFLSGSIEMSDVYFRYGEDSPYVVQGLSLKIRPGEYVALVGRSGCGKSTILRLMLGFEKPERGSIFFGRYDVSKVDLRSLRQSIGTVMQDGKLFMGDIASNITISSPGATMDDAWEAARIAGIAKDIEKMPMGMRTLVTEGSGGISGGQRQRIMIARAVCGNRKVLVLDEATSALDNVTQRHVADSLGMLNCTRVVVAHRLSTVRHCDRILVVDEGRIAEEGTYDELIERNGLFAELVARQRLD